MTEIATRLQVGIAASAMAVAATLVPMAAQAAPSISSMPTAPVTQVLNNLAEFNWFYFGPNPNTGTVPGIPAAPPGGIVLFSYNVPSLVPFWTSIGLLNTQSCFAGGSVAINAYGGLTFGFNAGGC
jgi:hypothetical protein